MLVDRARTAARACQGRIRARGSPARIAASRPTASTTPCCRPVDDVEMHGVAAHGAGAVELRAIDEARSGRALRRASIACRRSARRRRPTLRAAGHAHGEAACRICRWCPAAARARRARRSSLLALGVVGVGQQRLERHLDKIRIAVELVAVGVSELGAFDQRMDEIGARRIDACRD